MGFYDDMAKMAEDLLKPDSQGGLGQGEIVLTHIEQGAPNPETPWIPVEPIKLQAVLNGVARGVSERLVGTEVNGVILVATDLVVTCAVPSMEYSAGDVLTIDGKQVDVISYDKIPAAGTTTAVRFIVRG